MDSSFHCNIHMCIQCQNLLQEVSETDSKKGGQNPWESRLIGKIHAAVAILPSFLLIVGLIRSPLRSSMLCEPGRNGVVDIDL